MAKQINGKSEDGVITAKITKSFTEKYSENVLSIVTGATEALPSTCVQPPYDFNALYRIFEVSTFLRPNIEAYMTNIESFGHHFNPNVDLADDHTQTRIADSLLYSQYMEVDRAERDAADVTEPSKELIDEAIKRLRLMARMEFIRLNSFFSNACSDYSFINLRRNTRQDLEVIGNAFWEVVRNQNKEIAELHYQHPLRMRLTKQDKEFTEVSDIIPETDVSWVECKRKKRFRRFVQLGGTALEREGIEYSHDNVWFKELGDPRTISHLTGKIYKNEGVMKKIEPNAHMASEILHFKLQIPTSPYGIPRWIQNLPCVYGSRELDEVNYSFFKNNVVPPLALLVSGGKLGKGVANRFEEYINEHLKGKKGMFRMLILEATGQKVPGDSGPRQIPKLQFVPLRDSQQQDALFQVYDERNEEKLAKSFRLPRILRGDDTKTPRAAAFASLKFADEQVFEPERETFDDIINSKILRDLNIRFWKFRSNAPIVRDPEKMVEMIERLVKVGVLTPREAREIASDIFNKAFTDVAEEWTNKPLPYVLAQLKAHSIDLETHPISQDPGDPPVSSEPTSTRSKNTKNLPSLNQPQMRMNPLKPLGFNNLEGDDDNE